MDSLVPLKTMVIVARLANDLLSGGYIKIPFEYLDEDEINHHLNEAIANAAQYETSSEVDISDVLGLTGLETKLDTVQYLKGHDWDTLMGSFTISCSEHPTACLVSINNSKALCIVGFDGNTTGDASRYFSITSDFSAKSTPKVVTVDSEYDLTFPDLREGQGYHAIIVQSTCFAQPPPPRKKARTDEKGKEEEEEEKNPPSGDASSVEQKKTKKTLDIETTTTKRKRTTRTRKK